MEGEARSSRSPAAASMCLCAGRRARGKLSHGTHAISGVAPGKRRTECEASTSAMMLGAKWSILRAHTWTFGSAAATKGVSPRDDGPDFQI